MHLKLDIFGVENIVLKYGGSQDHNPKSADPFLPGSVAAGKQFVLWLETRDQLG